MIRKFLCSAVVLVLTGSTFGAVDLFFAQAGVPLKDQASGVQLVEINEYQTYTIQLWATNHDASTLALSAYLFRFDDGDFVTGKLQTTNWIESASFTGLNPPWLPVDQALNSKNADYMVEAVSGSIQMPLAGPAMPVDAPVLLATFNTYIDAPSGEHVDFLLSAQSGIDDQAGNLPPLGDLGVQDLLVTPEPATILLLLSAVFLFRRHKCWLPVLADGMHGPSANHFVSV